MAVWLDIAGSFLISVMLLFTVMRTNADIAESANMAVLDLMVQRSAGSMATILGEDLRKAGIGAPAGDPGIVHADDEFVVFWADRDSTAAPDTLIGYYVGNELGPNSEGPFLYRDILNAAPTNPHDPSDWNDPAVVGAGLIHFQFLYINAAGDTLATPLSSADLAVAREIRAEYRVVSEVIADTTYARSLSSIQVAPMNLRF